VEHPRRAGYEMVKRVKGLPGDAIGGRMLGSEEFWVLGDRGEASTDSREFGPVSSGRLKGRVLLVYGPRHRRRIIPRSL
jgi:Signal peptidase, peptidase S26